MINLSHRKGRTDTCYRFLAEFFFTLVFFCHFIPYALEAFAAREEKIYYLLNQTNSSCSFMPCVCGSQCELPRTEQNGRGTRNSN